MPSFAPEAVANAFLSKPGAQGRLTQMQLQKLVYIAHGWMLGLSGLALVDQEPEAWDRGPVFPKLRDHVKLAGASAIKSLIHENDDNPFAFLSSGDRGRVYEANLSEYEQQVVDYVWGRYGSLGAFRLSDLTHLPDTPWSKTYDHGRGKNDPIPNPVIQEYYSRLATEAAQQAS